MDETNKPLDPGLLATKFHRPPIPARWVQRAQLVRRLDEGLALGRQVTLVSAPAGFGKTTCISEWLGGRDDLPAAWLSLDQADDDPVRFWAYFLAALQKVDVHLGKEIAAVMRAGQLPPAEIISTALVNDILESDDRFLLVLDDFQVIQDAYILQVMENLLSGSPPPLHLVLLTREDPPLPLARLRANNRLTEIRAGDLRFNRGELDHFLNGIMDLSLTRTDLEVLEEKTEGWAAGLQMAAIAMKSALSASGNADISSFIAALSGSHRFILSYLSEQVLNRQPAEIRQFLLQTAVLDRLNSDLCNAVTGRADGRDMLERLFSANLFLVPLDEGGQWYRYHHLFADLLRDLQAAYHPQEMTDLHRRASRWYAEAGGGSAFASEAIQHALAAQDYEMAAGLIEAHGMGMVMQGYAKTVNNWVEAIPETWRMHSPRTHLALAWMHLLRGAYSQAVPYLAQVEDAFSSTLFSPAERHSFRAEWLVMQSLMRNLEENFAESLLLVEEALEIVPQEDLRVRSLVYFGLACVYQGLDQYEPVLDAYRKAVQYGRASKNLIAQLLSISGMARQALEHGQLRLAFEIAAPACAEIEETGSVPPISTVLFGIMAEVQYQWHQIEQAHHNLQVTLQLSTLGGYTSGMANGRVLLSRLHLLDGNVEAAAREIQTSLEQIRVRTPDYVRQEVAAQQVRVYLAQDHLAAAELALQGEGFTFRDGFGCPELPEGSAITYSLALLYSSSLHLLLYRSQALKDPTGLRAGMELADQLVARAPEGQNVLEALLLRARMQAALGSEPASREDFLRALELGEPEGFIGVFVEQGQPVADALADLAKTDAGIPHEYLGRILSAFRRSPRRAGEGDVPLAAEAALELLEDLSEREQEVLRLMAAGLKYKEIAARLFISLNTVRFHVKAIYGKLQVNNRTQAIESGRRLGLI